ncbi:hypothetical protein HDU96_008684 [Phlyctochytrium bullatum]|nr:hypothetical protein HDU96_008684 [Phlyctochytrium bullatum]
MEVLKELETLTNKFEPKDHIIEEARKRTVDLCTNFEKEAKAAADYLIAKIGDTHSKVRYKVVLAADLVFMASHAFRVQFLTKFHRFAQHSLGIQDFRLPDPPDFAKLCRECSLKAIKRWSERFGSYYKRLDVGYAFLVERVNIDFGGADGTVNFLGQLDAELHEKRRLSKVRRQIFDSVSAKIMEEMPNMFENLNEMVRVSYALPRPKLKYLVEIVCQLDSDIVDIARHYNLFVPDDPVCTLTLETIRLPLEDDGNVVIFEAIRECMKLLTTKHIDLLEKWQQSIVKLDTDTGQRKDTVDLLSRALLSSNLPDDDEDETFEEVED